MNLRIGLSMLLCCCFVLLPGLSQSQVFDKPAYYRVMESGTAEGISRQLNSLKGLTLTDKEAYEGALLMKQAGLPGKAKDKLSLFKSGRIKLEAAISKDNSNAEYRFLRIIIQEHAPKIVKYRSNLDEDSRMVQANYKNLGTVLQQQIIDYSKTSKILKTP